MAEIQGAGERGSKRGSARCQVSRPGAGAAGDAVREGPEPAGSANPAVEQQRSRGNGLEKLKRAVNRRLGRDSETLADLLLEKAKEGKAEDVRLLVTLAERKQERKPEVKKKRQRPSWAELLASEPEWVEEKPEVGDVWMGDGWRRPSGEIVRQ